MDYLERTCEAVNELRTGECPLSQCVCDGKESAKIVVVVTEKPVVTKYFCSMDPSIQFLLGVDVPTPEGATIHSIAPPPPVPIDDDKIGFTLDVAMRLDQEMAVEDVPGDNVISINEHLPEDLADSA